MALLRVARIAIQVAGSLPADEPLPDPVEEPFGSDVLGAALEGYALAKVFGKGAGLDALKDVVSVRFSGRRKSGGVATP